MMPGAQGWYSDPTVGGAARWWDGQRWHDTLRAEIDGKALLVGEGRIALGETALATDAIHEVSIDDLQRKWNFRRVFFRLEAGQERLSFSFEYYGNTPPLLWFVLTGFLDAGVLPRIASELTSRVISGETVRIGGFAAVRQGISGRAGLRNVTLPWSGIREVSRMRVYLFVNGLDSSGRNQTLKTKMAKPNVSHSSSI